MSLVDQMEASSVAVGRLVWQSYSEFTQLHFDGMRASSSDRANAELCALNSNYCRQYRCGGGRALARKYGVHAYDRWSVDELLMLVQGGVSG